MNRVSAGLLTIIALLSNAASAQGNCLPAPPGLVGWWQAEDDAVDRVFGNDGALLNETGFTPGLVGHSFDFDGVDDYVEIPQTTEIFFSNTEAFTVELWFRPQSETDSFFMLMNAAYGFQWRGSTNSLAFYNGNYHYSARTSWPLDQWYHLAVVDDGTSSVRLYVNGVLDKSDDGIDRNPNRFLGFPLQVGFEYIVTGSRFFDGHVDELSIYNRALDPVEVTAIFNAGMNGKCALLDDDGDGFTSPVDCNDADPLIFPGAPETCDGRDNDCNDVLDDDPTCDTTCDSEQILVPVAQSDPSPLSLDPVVAWTGAYYGVAWSDTRDGNNEIYLTVVDTTGQSTSGDLRVTSDAHSSLSPSIAWTGSEYGLVWSDSRDGNEEIYFVRLQDDGVAIGEELRLTNAIGLSGTPDIAWSGSEYGIVWSDERQGGGRLYFARVSASGVKLGQDLVVPATNCPSGFRPSIVWTGQHYAVVWFSGGLEICFARLDASGALAGPDTQITNSSGRAVYPSLSWTGSGFGVVWSDSRDGGDREVYFARLDPTGVRLGDETRITETVWGASPSSLAWTGSDFLVAWYLNVTGRQIYAARVGLNGTLSGSPLLLGNATTSTFTGSAPSIIWNGAGFATAWYGNGKISLGRVACNCFDLDSDGYTGCVDCDDESNSVHPGASELCNGRDDDCNGVIDDSPQGLDPDADNIPSACDNCRSAYNPTQMDTDHDLIGNSCDNCLLVANPSQADLDTDQRGDVCDNCPAAANGFQDDTDADLVGDVCDNCVLTANRDQGDVNADFVGDVCDLNDGVILIRLPDDFTVEWQQEAGFEAFNWYRGDLSVLKGSGLYTQDPNTVPLAGRECGLVDAYTFDVSEPAVGKAVFFLVTGVQLGVEGGLGINSAGVPRPNANPCP